MYLIDFLNIKQMKKHRQTILSFFDRLNFKSTSICTGKECKKDRDSISVDKTY